MQGISALASVSGISSQLQGWTDDYFEKAEFVNSDSQLYKQAGNGVTVNVVYEIGKALR